MRTGNMHVRFALDQVFKFKGVSEDKIKDLMMGDGIVTRSKKKEIEEDVSLLANISRSEEE